MNVREVSHIYISTQRSRAHTRTHKHTLLGIHMYRATNTASRAHIHT